jgi:phosphonate transport system substrate-binding protein
VTPGSPLAFRTLTFAVVSGLDEAPALLRRLCEELGELTPRIVIPQLLRSQADLALQISRGMVHIGWMPPLLALQLSQAGTAKVAFCSVRAGQSSYHSVLYTRRGTEVRTLADLAGRHAAWVERNSAAGYVIPRLRLASAGLNPDKLFGRESFHEAHAHAARAVFSGAADIGATFAVFDQRAGRLVRAGWQEAGIPLDHAHLLATAGPIPSDGIVLSTKLPPDIAAELTGALAQLTRRCPDAVRTLLGADEFAPPQAMHFDELAKLVTSARKGA